MQPGLDIAKKLDDELHALYKEMLCSWSRCRECGRYLYRDDLEQVWCGCNKPEELS